jgi:phage-related protein
MKDEEKTKQKPLHWIGSTKRDLKKFPKDVMRVMGQALDDAQWGGKHPDTKPFKGYKGAGVLEIVDDHQGDTYRAIYTVKLANAVYVLHAFQKKAKKGIKTPKKDVDLIGKRYKAAEAHHAALLAAAEKDKETDQ